MSRDELPEKLARLRAELDKTSGIEPQAQRKLQEMIRDAEALHARPGSEVHSFGERLEELAVRFEAEHPTLGASLRELVELLGKAGL